MLVEAFEESAEWNAREVSVPKVSLFAAGVVFFVSPFLSFVFGGGYPPEPPLGGLLDD